MLSEDARLRIECLLRRAGLAGVPAPVLACLVGMMAVLVVVAFWQFWPSAAVQDGYEYRAAAHEGTAQGSASQGSASQGSASQGSSTQESAVLAEQAGVQPGAGDGTAGDTGTSESDAVGSATSATSTGASRASGQEPVASSSKLCVDVEGAVKRPGLYRVAAGSRVGDAVKRAGGMTGSAARGAVNLAQKLEDGMQVYVPEKGEDVSAGQVAEPSSAGTAAGQAAFATSGVDAYGRVNLNTASLEELQTLPGVGPVLAQSIVAYREQSGRFEAIEELKNVSGIGDARFDRLKDAVCV